MPTRQVLPLRFLEMAWQAARIAFAAGACAAAIYVVVGTAWTAIQTYPRVIFWDMWGWLVTLRAWLESGFTWSSLFALDNEHRIVVGRLLFFVDYLIDSQNSGMLVALTLAQYFATVAILVMLFRRAAGPDADWIATTSFTAFAGVMLFAGSNLEILQFGYQVMYAWALVAMPVAALMIVLSVEASKRGSNTRAAVWITLTIFVCATATYSTGGGMPIWPLVFFLALFCGVPRRHLVVIVIVAMICIGGYFIGYHPSGTASNLTQTIGHAETYTLFLPVFLGNPFAPEFEIAKARALSPHAWFVTFGWLGMFGVAGVIWIWITSWLTRRPWQPAQLALFAILIYGVIVGLFVAFLRQNWGWIVAIADRYRTAPALFWIAGFMLLASIFWNSHHRKKAVLLIVGSLMAIMMTVVVSHQRDALRFYSDRHQRWLVTADAFRVGVIDWQAFRNVAFVLGPGLLPLVQFIRDRRLSVFSDGRFELVGRPFDENFRATSDTICNGEVDERIAIPDELNAWRLSGSVWNVAERQSPQHLLLVDNATNHIVGLGTGGLSLLDIPGGQSRNFAKRDGWAGYVRALPEAVVTVYGIASDGKSACRIAITRLGSALGAIDVEAQASLLKAP